jgi:streptogramin lyase
MFTQEQDFLDMSSGKDAPTSPPLDTLAKTLADGTISRKQALMLMGAGATVASFAMAGCGGGKKDQARGSTSGSREPSAGGSTSNTTVGQKGSTPKQGPGGEQGQIEVYGSAPLVGTPLNMTVDEDQRFWWTDVTTKGLGSIEPLSADPESTMRRIDLPNGRLPMQPRVGPGGTIWYTDAGRNGFGRIEAGARNPAATLEFFTTDGMPPLLGLAPLGPDRRFWFGSEPAGIVGCFDPARDDPAQSVKIFESSALSGVTGLYPGPDDHIWIANVGADSIARIDPLAPDPGATIEVFPRPPGGIHPRAWRVGPDRKMWFSQRDQDALLRLDPLGPDWTQTIETVCGPDAVNEPDGLCPGPDGHLWFCNAGNNSIGRLDPRAPEPASTLVFYTASDVRTPFDLQNVGDYMVFTNLESGIGRILARV